MESVLRDGAAILTRSVEDAILGAIDEKAWLDLACELVPAGQPESENPLDPDQPAGREEGIAFLIADKLREMDFAVELISKREGRPNVVGLLSGACDGPTLIVNDHLDTYPAGDWNAWTMTNGHPFRPVRHGDRLYARGTSDTRGNLACTLLAMKAIRQASVKLRGALKAVYTVDEEKNGPDGSIFLLDEHGLTADAVIVCEPTGWTRPDGSWGMGIATANCGHTLIEVETRGVKSHLWRPDTGVNAVAKMARLLTLFETMTFRHEPTARAGGTPPMVAIIRVEGGLKREMQFTPDVCRATLAVVGILPGMTPDGVMADIEAVIDGERARDARLEASARLYPGALFVSGTMEQDERRNPAAALARHYERLMGEAPALYRKNAFNDTIRFAERGIPAVTFGPGEDGWPPVNEYIDIPKAVAATKILALTIVDILGLAA
jgi:acetylornithine deacetylase